MTKEYFINNLISLRNYGNSSFEQVVQRLYQHDFFMRYYKEIGINLTEHREKLLNRLAKNIIYLYRKLLKDGTVNLSNICVIEFDRLIDKILNEEQDERIQKDNG